LNPSDLLRELELTGGRVCYRPPDGLIVEIPAAEQDRLLPLLLEFKPAILALLGPRPPEGPCPAGHPGYWWRAAENQPWRCGRCEPDPRAALWDGITMADVGARALSLAAPPCLPAVREWVLTPAGLGTVLAYAAAGEEVFVRLFHPRPGQRPAGWFPARRVIAETAPEAFGHRRQGGVQ
jgi:hypothetical protein